MLLDREIATTRPSVRPFSPFPSIGYHFLPADVLRKLRALQKLLGADYAGAFECNLSDNGCEFAKFNKRGKDCKIFPSPDKNTVKLDSFCFAGFISTI